MRLLCPLSDLESAIRADRHVWNEREVLTKLAEERSPYALVFCGQCLRRCTAGALSAVMLGSLPSSSRSFSLH